MLWNRPRGVFHAGTRNDALLRHGLTKMFAYDPA